jgi:hypothetical protein
MKVNTHKLRVFFLKNKNSSLSLLMWGGLFFILGCAMVFGYLGGYDRKVETKRVEKVTEIKQSSSTSNTPKKVKTPKSKEKTTSKVQSKIEISEPPITQPVSDVPEESQRYTAQYGAYTGISSVSYDEAYQEAKQAFDNAEKARIEQEEQANRQAAEELKESILQQDPNAVVNIIQ